MANTLKPTHKSSALASCQELNLVVRTKATARTISRATSTRTRRIKRGTIQPIFSAKVFGENGARRRSLTIKLILALSAFELEPQ